MHPLLKFLSAIPDIFLPKSCPLCGEDIPPGESKALCESCRESFDRSRPPWCPTCGKPFRSEAALSHTPDHLCAECRERPPSFEAARAFGPYEGSLRELIQLIKFRGYPSLATELGSELSRLALEEYPDIISGDALVTHVPIARDRWRERGFDQAKILAQSTAVHLGVAFASTLERGGSTSPQTSLSAPARRKILQGFFSAISMERVSGKNIILVDDVLTTGSTAGACSRVLKKSGAASVCVLTICHTVIQKRANR